ncbi:Sensor histidine kinase DesK [Corynebacterium ciconiae DSM 44920]|uniref:sensor histidine kinase n=1 Tax=Corynebacterium ciconiae TaxID=227319 RepID=UPI00035EE0A4|nr:histidine kinase [Corynebacterium ciconiae]WKD62089.1 Sensor histidine kinase DesK [Corynebacterium ciconiae DSM 44920]
MNSLIRTPAALSVVTRAVLVPMPLFVVALSTPPTASFLVRTSGTWPVLLSYLLTLPIVALCAGALWLAPALRMHTSAKQRRLFHLCTRWGVISVCCAIALSAVLLSLGGDTGQGIALVVWFSCTVCASYALVPWTKQPAILALILTALLIPVATHMGWLVLIWPLLGEFTTWCSRWTFDVFKAQRRVHDVEAALQLSQERLRIAQELHDSLGHQLAAMSVKTQLAAAFAEKNDPRLREELHQLHALIHDSSEHMRQVVRGYRTVDPATELDSARDLLSSAGITVNVRGDLADLAAHTADHSMLAWFIREAATNVLRHSHARHVDVELTPQSVTMTNDGATGPLGPLSGLAAIRQRCAPLGITVELYQQPHQRVSAAMRWNCPEESDNS